MVKAIGIRQTLKRPFFSLLASAEQQPNDITAVGVRNLGSIL
jgi:hypothetical protein